MTFYAKCEHCQGRESFNLNCTQSFLLEHLLAMGLAADSSYKSFSQRKAHLTPPRLNVLLITLSISESYFFSMMATFLLCLSGFCIILGTRQFLALEAQILRDTCAVLLIQKSPKQGLMKNKAQDSGQIDKLKKGTQNNATGLLT